MKKRRKPIKRLNDAMKRRTMIACGIIALLFVLLIGRLIYFSIFKNGIYKRQVLSQQNYSSETLPYKRGDILDRDGNTLATSQKMYTLVLDDSIEYGVNMSKKIDELNHGSENETL